jgi:hypothetical protein
VSRGASQEFLEKADKGKEGGGGGADHGISDALNEVRRVISFLLAVPIVLARICSDLP